MSLFDDFDDEEGLDDFEDDDAVLESVEDEEQSKRQQAFEKKVNERINQVQNRKSSSKQRQDAVVWLGESGEPKAIPVLIKAYKQEKDAGIREAIRYALGQFKALQMALDGDEDEREKALDLVDAIIIEGKMGRRASLSSSTLLKVMGGLLVLFVILMGVYLVAPAGGDNTPRPTPTELAQAGPASDDPLTVQSDLRDLQATLTTQTQTLETQLNLTLAGGSPDCSAISTIISQPTYPLSDEIRATYPLLTTAGETLNQAREEIASAKAPFDMACQPQPNAISDDAKTSIQTALTNARTALGTVPALLDDPQAAASPIPPTETPSPPPTETPTPTVDPNIINRHIQSLNILISDMNSLRGKNSILVTYWTDIINTGATGGCLEPPPELPTDYTIPADQQSILPQPLLDAVIQINTGLTLSRASWAEFEAGCLDNSLDLKAPTEITRAQLAGQQFTEAEQKLRDVQR